MRVALISLAAGQPLRADPGAFGDALTSCLGPQADSLEHMAHAVRCISLLTFGSMPSAAAIEVYAGESWHPGASIWV